MGTEIRPINFENGERNQTGDTVVVWDQDTGTATTLFSLFDFLDPTVDRTTTSDADSGFFWTGCNSEQESQDWTHSNAIWVTQSGSTLISVRHLNQIVSVNPDSDGLDWQLGGPNSDFTFPDPSDQFYLQHSVKELPNGNILLFDNGNGRPQEEGGQYSRSLELELDFDNMTASKIWEYRNTPELFAACCSNVTRLDNGNSVMVFGFNPAGNVFTIVEADSSGNQVSTITVSSPGQIITYRVYPLDSINGESIQNP